MIQAKKIRSMMLAIAVLLIFGFAFTSCSNDDLPRGTNTISLNGTTSNVVQVARFLNLVSKGENNIIIDHFMFFISAGNAVTVCIPRNYMGMTLDLTKKWSINADNPTGISVWKLTDGNWKITYFSSPDENGKVRCTIKQGTMTVNASDDKVNVYAKGIGLYYESRWADPVEVPFEIRYSGPDSTPAPK